MLSAVLTCSAAAIPLDWNCSGLIDSRDLFIYAQRWHSQDIPWQETPYGAGDLLTVVQSWQKQISSSAEHIPQTVEIPAGTFLMGNLRKGTDRGYSTYPWSRSREFPMHWVHLDRYFIGAYEVTLEEYAEFLNDGNDAHWYSDMAHNAYCGISRTGVPGSYFYQVLTGREKYPIVYVRWYDAVAYCNWLREKTQQPFRLPTEAEWEKAARWDPINETAYIYPWGDTYDSGKMNCWQASLTHVPKPVGSYPSGARYLPMGVLYDMAGNVWEYASDFFQADYYKQGPGGDDPGSVVWDNPKGPSAGSARVIRGGSWANMAYSSNDNDGRCAARHLTYPSHRHTTVGFRVAKGP